ncbi:hypothetical protein Lfu02_14550 [Longispora fulva]|nr:hypothetical protein Lfu02_14550 [Longispora fulva]
MRARADSVFTGPSLVNGYDKAEATPHSLFSQNSHGSEPNPNTGEKLFQHMERQAIPVIQTLMTSY